MQSQLDTIGNAIRSLLRGLARNEAAFKCDILETDPGAITIAVTFDRDDYPRIIGKDGGTIDCILRIVDGIARENDVKINLEVVPPAEPKRDAPAMAEFKRRSNWPQHQITSLFDVLCKLLSKRATMQPQHTELLSIYSVNLDNETIRDLAFLFRLIGRKVGRVIQVRAK